MKGNRVLGFFKALFFFCLITIMSVWWSGAGTMAGAAGLLNPGFEDGTVTGTTYPKSWTVLPLPPPDVVAVVGAENSTGFATYADMGNITVKPVNGKLMLRQGTPKRNAEKQPIGKNGVYQDFISSANQTSFYFRLFSWEFRGQDVFEFNLTDNATGKSVGTLMPFTINMAGVPKTFSSLPVSTTINMPKGASFVDTNWVKVTITNVPTDGVLRLTFGAGGTNDNAHATWAYFDGNVPPLVSVNQPTITVDEGQAATNSGTYSDADGDNVTITASVGAVTKTGTGSGTWSWSYTSADGPATNTVTITANDGNGGITSTTFSLTVNNVPPASVTLTPTPASINENDSTTVSGTFTDPGTLDTHTVAIDWGDGSPATNLNLGANILTFSASHQYLDNKPANAPYAVTAKVTDKDGGSGSGSTALTVNNVAPGSVTLSATPASINENDSTTVNGSFTDPGTLDTHTVVIDWGDGSPATNLNLAAKVLVFSASHQYLDNKPANAPYTVTANVTDEATGSGSTASDVNNVAPTATLTVPPTPVLRKSIFSISLTSPQDPGTLDVAAGFTYAFDSGTGSGYGAFSANNTANLTALEKPGTQTVKGQIRDKDGGVTEYTANITVYNTPPVATVSLNNTSPKTNDILTATATKSDVDGDLVTLTFVWKKNGVVTKTTVNSTALSDSYDLSIPGNGDKGDTISVEVTPNDGYDNGAVVIAQATVVNSPPVADFKFTVSHITDNRTRNGASFNTTYPMEGGRIQFRDLSSDVDPGDGVVSWQWHITGAGTNITSSMQSPYFNPPDNGLYVVSLTVTDRDGAPNTATSGQNTTNGRLVRKLLVINTPPKVNALNLEVRAGDGAFLFGRFLDHGWLDAHTANWSVQGITSPFSGMVIEDLKPVKGTGIVTGSISAADLRTAVGGRALPVTFSGNLTVSDGHASRTDNFTITVVADNRTSREPNNDLLSSLPPVLTTDSVWVSYIQSSGDVDIFEIQRPVLGVPVPLPAGSEVLVTLKGLPADYDLVLATLGGAASSDNNSSSFGTATFDAGNFQISGFDDSGFDDSGFDDSGFDDSGFDDSGFDDSGFDDSGFDDSGFDDSGFDDSGFDDSGFDDSGFDDSAISSNSFTGLSGSSIGGTDLTLSELGLGNILTGDYRVVGFSANRGTDNETLLTRIAVAGTRLFVIVVGPNGAHSNAPYSLQIESSAPAVKPPTGKALVSPSTPQTFLRLPQESAPMTLFVTQQDRLKALYSMNATAWDTLQSKLVTLAAHSAVRGDILSLPSSIYDSWDINPSSVDEANKVADQVRSIIQTYLAGHSTIQYVVMVGSDDVVPYRRVPDETFISNERYYLRSSYLKLGSPLFSSVLRGNNLTDDFYVSARPMSWQGRELYIPDMPVGRLVETPQEIGAAADAFLGVNGILSPRTAFVSGYDFFSDGAQVIASNLAAGGLSTSNLISTNWTADNLGASLLGAPSPDIDAPNAHFTHYAALSASGFTNRLRDFLSSIRVAPSEVKALLNRLVFSIGCHAGLNVPDRESRAADPGLGINPSLDFAQAMAQQNAIYIASTGYGLGDTEGLGGTERLLTILAKNFVSGNVSVGDALVGAKQTYLSSLSPMTVYDEKSSIETTLYGLPMYRIQLTIPPAASSSSSGDHTLTITDGAASTNVTYNLQTVTTRDGTYYMADGDAQATAGRSLEPRIVRPLVANGSGVVHGVLLTSGNFSDTPPGFDPVISRPTNEWERNATEPQTPLASFWPSELGTANGLLTARGLLQSLILVPGQFKATSAPGTTVKGIQRLYDNLSFELLRSTSSDWQPPAIQSVDFRALNDTSVAVTVDANDPSGIARIVVLRISSGSLSPTSLVLNTPFPTSGQFTLNVPFITGDTLLVEVADDPGNIALATGKGATFSVIKVDMTADQAPSSSKSVVLKASVANFDNLTRPVSFLWDFGDGTFLDGQTTNAIFSASHTYSGNPTQATASVKVTDAGGGVGVDKLLLLFDPANDVGSFTSSANANLVGGAAWIDATSMNIILRVAGTITDEFQYRVFVTTNTTSALLKYDGGKVTGPSSLTATPSGSQLIFRFNLADLGLKSGDSVQLSAETQAGIKGAATVGKPDDMPDSGTFLYVLY